MTAYVEIKLAFFPVCLVDASNCILKNKIKVMNSFSPSWDNEQETFYFHFSWSCTLCRLPSLLFPENLTDKSLEDWMDISLVSQTLYRYVGRKGSGQHST